MTTKMMYSDIFRARILEIQKCIENECFLSALSMALTLPDICGKAAYPELGNTKRYIQWYNTTMSDMFAEGTDMPYLSGELIYNLRNSILHSGNPNISVKDIKNDQCRVDKFILECKPNGAVWGGSMSRSSPTDTYWKQIGINIPPFCELLVEKALEYYVNNKDKFTFFDYTMIG